MDREPRRGRFTTEIVLPFLGEEGQVLHLVDARRQNRAALDAIKRDNGAVVSR